MLGDKIGEMSGKINSQRVLANPGGGPKMETSFQANGSLLGTDVKETGTYCTVVRPDGTLYGEGQGVTMTKDGKMATWTGHGVGTTKKDGTAISRGPICVTASSAAPRPGGCGHSQGWNLNRWDVACRPGRSTPCNRPRPARRCRA